MPQMPQHSPTSKSEATDEQDLFTTRQALELITWHIDRYDRLRGSTASRAAVVLSAGAILSAGNAIIIAQLLGGFRSISSRPLLAVFTGAGAVCVILVILAVLHASSVLVTSRPSRELLAHDDELPSGSPFNGRDAVQEHRSFRSFKTQVAGLDAESVLNAGYVELWICIHQHRRRYGQLRKAVRLLQVASVEFIIIMLGLLIANVVLQAGN